MPTPLHYDRATGCVVGRTIQPVPVDGEYAATVCIAQMHERERQGIGLQTAQQRVDLGCRRILTVLALHGGCSTSEIRRRAGYMSPQTTAKLLQELERREQVRRCWREVVLTQVGRAACKEMGLTPKPHLTRETRARSAVGGTLSRADGEVSLVRIATQARLSQDAVARVLAEFIEGGEVTQGAVGYRWVERPPSPTRGEQVCAAVLERLRVAHEPLSLTFLVYDLHSSYLRIREAIDTLERAGKVRFRREAPRGWVLADAPDSAYDPPPSPSKQSRRDASLLEVLHALAEADPAPVTRDAISFRTGRGGSTTSRLLGDLVEAGGVKAVLNGRRGAGYVLTDAGRAAVVDARASAPADLSPTPSAAS